MRVKPSENMAVILTGDDPHRDAGRVVEARVRRGAVGVSRGAVAYECKLRETSFQVEKALLYPLSALSKFEN